MGVARECARCCSRHRIDAFQSGFEIRDALVHSDLTNFRKCWQSMLYQPSPPLNDLVRAVQFNFLERWQLADKRRWSPTSYRITEELLLARWQARRANAS